MEQLFIRDEHSKACINTNTVEIQMRRQQKRQAQKVTDLQKEINEVKNDLLEIKQLLQTIISERG